MAELVVAVFTNEATAPARTSGCVAIRLGSSGAFAARSTAMKSAPSTTAAIEQGDCKA